MNSSPDMVKDNNKNEPLVSIIVITYNSAKFVLETLESAKTQTYENIELIVSDDASTDDTVEICHTWIGKNKNRFVRTELITVPENTGIPANCNRGLRAAKGEWVKFIAGDDALYEHAIQSNISFVHKNPYVKALFTSMDEYQTSFNCSSLLQKVPSSNSIDVFLKLKTAKDQYFFLITTGGFLGVTPTAFILRRFIVDADGFDERFKHNEDLPMWIKLTKIGVKFYFNPIITVKYRRHNLNIDNVGNPLIKPSFFKNEMIRKEYAYKHLTKFEFFHQKYRFIIYTTLFNLKLIKRNKTNRIIFVLLTNYLNPFFIIRRMCYKLFKYKIRLVLLDAK
jgi:glycosyltransferase involved in cell wall biosynthesis